MHVVVVGWWICLCLCLFLYLCVCEWGFSYFPYKMENFLYVAFVSFSTHVKWFSSHPTTTPTNTSFSAHSHLFRKLCKCIYKQLCFRAAMFVRRQPQNFARIFPQLRGIFISLLNFLPLNIVFTNGWNPSILAVVFAFSRIRHKSPLVL